LRISKLLGPKNFPVSGVGIRLVVLGQLVTEVMDLMQGVALCVHNAGVVELVADYTVCTEGEPVSPEASRILVCSFSQGNWSVFLNHESKEISQLS
jgi:hypothetical protein